MISRSATMAPVAAAHPWSDGGRLQIGNANQKDNEEGRTPGNGCLRHGAGNSTGGDGGGRHGVGLKVAIDGGGKVRWMEIFLLLIRNLINIYVSICDWLKVEKMHVTSTIDDMVLTNY